jgi:hypothetical protein
MPVVSVRLLADAVYTRLAASAGLSAVYKTVVPGDPARDNNLVIKAYAVFHPAPGDSKRGALNATPGQLLWDFQVTCVGGDHDYLLDAVDSVRTQLEGYRLIVAGAVVGLCQPPIGFRPPPARPDLDEKPSRLWVPLLFQVLAVPA